MVECIYRRTEARVTIEHLGYLVACHWLHVGSHYDKAEAVYLGAYK